METISPQASPTSTSISPPVTPYSIALPYALPPLKTLPTWNRNKFKDSKISKLVRSVPKNKNIKVELIGQIENCTQTSPPAFTSRETLSSPKTTCRKSANIHNNGISNIKKSYDRKVSFLESNHKEVLTNLHRELERMKIENKALKFKLVMTTGEGPASFDDDEKVDLKMPNLKEFKRELEKNKLLKSEIKELKNLLDAADSKNIHLSKLVETLKESKLTHSGTLKTKLISTYLNDQPVSLSSTQENKDLVPENDTCRSSTTEDNTMLPEEKRQKSNTECSLIFPKLEQPNSRTTHVLISTSAKRGQEPISLPMLQGLPSNRNMSLRQKRARALHVQRQRSNKNVTLTATTAVIKNE